jgi:hypothetical protein
MSNKNSNNAVSGAIKNSTFNRKKTLRKKCTSLSSNSTIALVTEQQRTESLKNSCIKSSNKKHDRDEGSDEPSHDTKGNTTTSGINCIEELFAKKRELKKMKQCSASASSDGNHDDNGPDIQYLTNKNSYGGTTTTKKSSSTKKLLHGDRSDLERLQSGEWVDDGLGGKFNSDGFTGRRDEQSGFKVFKAHLLNKKGFGTTSLCPFDCDCCYI